MASYTPDRSIREAALKPSQSAILFIDTQNFALHPEGISVQKNWREIQVLLNICIPEYLQLFPTGYNCKQFFARQK